MYYYIQEKAVPHATFVCPGLVVVHKPPGWEVGIQQNGVAWLQSVMLVTSLVASWDKERQYGFAHRLDAICSGLLLAAVALEVGTLLKWQMSHGTLMR